MSSTNRNGESREEFDFYPTPPWCVERLLEKVDFGPYFSSHKVWLEPCAGDGAIAKTIQRHYSAFSRFPFKWNLCEIQERFQPNLALVPNSTVKIGDFLETDFSDTPDIVITNPPFSHAFEFVKKCMSLEPAMICFLLRLNFLGSQERSSFMREYTPDIYVLPNRPSFKGKGTDSIEYAWFVWSLDNNYGSLKDIREPKLVILNETPKRDRVR